MEFILTLAMKFWMWTILIALIIIGFIWTNLTKDKGDQEVSIFITNSGAISYPKQS